MPYCAVYSKNCLCALVPGSVSTKRVEVGGFTHKVLCTGLDCKMVLVASGWAISRLGCTNGIRKYYSHLVGASFEGLGT